MHKSTDPGLQEVNRVPLFLFEDDKDDIIFQN